MAMTGVSGANIMNPAWAYSSGMSGGTGNPITPDSHLDPDVELLGQPWALCFPEMVRHVLDANKDPVNQYHLGALIYALRTNKVFDGAPAQGIRQEIGFAVACAERTLVAQQEQGRAIWARIYGTDAASHTHGAQCAPTMTRLLTPNPTPTGHDHLATTP